MAVIAAVPVLALLCSCIVLQASSAAEYYVRPNTSTLDCPASSELQPCLTLDEYARDTDHYFASNSRFTFLEGQHSLSTMLRLLDVVNISLIGVNADVTTLVVSEGSNIFCNNTVDVTLMSLKFIHFNYSFAELLDFLFVLDSDMFQVVNVKFRMSNRSVAIYFDQTTASLSNCSFYNGYHEYGGAVFSTLSNISFSGENIFENNRAGNSGGAIALQSSTVTFSGNNTFLNNTAGVNDTSVRGGGGALYITDSNVSFSGTSTFQDNAARSAGGAIHITLTSNVTFSGENTFLDNRLMSDVLGGGALSVLNSVIEFTGVNMFQRNGENGEQFHSKGGAVFAIGSALLFSNNTSMQENAADIGGGIACYSTAIFFSGYTDISSNLASSGVGGGVYLLNSSLDCLGSTVLSTNIAQKNGGGMFLDSSVVRFQESIVFDHNLATTIETVSRNSFTIKFLQSDGGGLYASNSSVAVSGIADFTMNVADHGGGMFIDSTAQLVLRSPVSMNFYHNFASDSGGALLIDDSDPSFLYQCLRASFEAENCAFRLETKNGTLFKNISLNFTENVAQNAGTAIFGGNLESCKLLINGVQSDTSGLGFLTDVSVSFPVEYQYNVSSVTSRPLLACFCKNGLPNCDLEASYTVIQVPRGKTFSVSVATVGQLNMPVPSRIISYIINRDESTELVPQGNNDQKVSQCRDLGFYVHTKRDLEHLVLHPEECSSEIATLIVEINFVDCPPGFVLVEDHCECEKRLQDLGMICNIDTGLIRRPNGSLAWIHPIISDSNNYSGFLWNPGVTPSRCRREDGENPIWLNFSTESSDDLCVDSRTGFQCGACKEGFSLILGTRSCEKCSNRYISLLIFFAFSGIALIVILLALHMTVAAGTINGLILYVNTVNICRGLFFPGGTPPNVLSVFISWLNLDFGIPLCFYDGLDSYAYFWLQYAYPFYLWTLIGLIFLINRISSRVGRLFGSNPVAVLDTIILLSFTKLLENIVRVLATRPLDFPDGTRYFWRADANLPFFQGRHAYLAVFSILILVFLLVPYVFILLFGYRLQAYSGRKCFNWLNKLKPFLDAYYAPFKKSARYWPGFLLLVRCFIFLSLTPYINAGANVHLLLVSSMFLGVAIIPWLNGRLYENFYLDILESSFMLNLLILFNATIHVQAFSKDQSPLTNTLVGIAFVEFFGISAFHLILRIWKKLRSMRFHEKKLFVTMRRKMTIRESQPSIEPPVSATNINPTTTTFTTVDMLRESLLDY